MVLQKWLYRFAMASYMYIASYTCMGFVNVQYMHICNIATVAS